MAGTKASVKPTENSASALQSSISTLVHNYRATTLTRTKLIDCFLLVLVVSGVLQFAYRILVTSYPFNAFLGRSVCEPSLCQVSQPVHRLTLSKTAY